MGEQFGAPVECQSPEGQAGIQYVTGCLRLLIPSPSRQWSRSGWQGPLWKRVIASAAADASHRRGYAPLDGWADPSSAVEAAIQNEWLKHHS